MIHNLAEKSAEKLIQKGADPENKEVLVYGIECAINEVIANIIMFSFAFIIGRPLEMLIWNAFMLPVRVNLGGHHAKSHFMCLAYSTALAILCVWLYPFILDLSWLIWIEIGVTLAVAYTFAPFIHHNRSVSESHRAKLKKWGKIVTTIESVIIILLFFFADPWLSCVAGLGMITASVLCIIGKVQEHFQSRADPN